MKKPNDRGDGGPLQPHPPELRERGYSLYEKGKSNAQIAEELQIPLNTISRWSSKGKWRLRKRFAAEGKALATSDKGLPNELNIGEIERLSFGEKQDRYSAMMAESAVRLAYVVKNLSAQGLVSNADKIAKLDQVARKALKLETDKPRSIVNVAFLATGKIKRLRVADDPAPREAVLLEQTSGKPVPEQTSDKPYAEVVDPL